MDRHSRPSVYCRGGSTCCICFKGFRWDSGGLEQHFRGVRDERIAIYGGRREDDTRRFRFLPRILMCCHNACDGCIRKVLSPLSNEILQCNLCRKPIDLPPSFQESDVDKLFPVNFYVLGTLCPGVKTEFFGECGDEQVSFLKSAVTKKETTVLKAQSPVQMCSECRGVGASFCDSCSAVFCHPCFTSVHAKAKVLMSHQSTSLLQNSSRDKLKQPMCSSHPQFKLEFFCIKCSVSICTECLITDHNGHKLQNIVEKNQEYLDEVLEAYTDASNIQRTARMSIKNAKKALMSADKGSDGTSYKAKIRDHFLQLHSHLVRLESELLARTNKSGRINSLNAAIDHLTLISEQINQALSKAKILVQNETCADFCGLVKELRELANLPCVLVRTENNEGSNCLDINDSIFGMLDEHVSLRVNDSIAFVVRSVDEAPQEATLEVDKLTVQEASAELKIRPFPRKPRNTSTPSNSDNSAEDIPVHMIPLPKTSKNRRGSSFSSGSADSSMDSYALDAVSRLTAPEMLVPGVSITVEVTHITSPSDFYVQRCSIKPKLEELTQGLARYCMQTRWKQKKEAKPFKEGDMCVTKYRRDGAWCRCEILSCKPGKSTMKVRYVDFGNTDKVEKNCVLRLPKPLTEIPPMAIRCGLARIMPASRENVEAGEWDFEVTNYLFDMFRGSLSKTIVVLNEDFEDIAQVRLVVEDSVCPIDVAMSLVYLGYAELNGVVYPDILKRANLKISFRDYNSQPRLCADELKDTCFELAHVESPSLFYIRIPVQAEFKEFDFRLQVECKRKEKWMEGDPIKVYWPVAGMAVAVFSENQHWERATIIEPLPDRLLHVFLVDVGRLETIEWDRAQVLDKYYFKFPPQAYKCSLLNIAPIDDKWSSDASDFLRSFRDNRALKVRHTVWNPASKCTGILLTRSSLSKEISINALLVKEGYATNTGPCAERLELPIPKPPKMPTDRVTKNVVPSRQSGQVDPNLFKDAVIRGPDMRYRVKVTVLKVVSPGEFYLKFDYLDSDYKELYQKIEHYFKQGDVESQEKLWKPNEICAIFDLKWKRAKVLEEPVLDEHEGTVVKVKFLDEVKEVTVPITTLRDLPEEFHTPGDRVVPCFLGGILPAPSGAWTHSSIREFQDFVAKGNAGVKLYMARMKNFNEGDDSSIVPVELFSYVERQPNVPASKIKPPLPSKGATPEAVWVSINHVLRMKGMAKPDEYTIWDSRGRRKYTTDENVEDSDEERFNLMEDEMEVLAHLMRMTFQWTPEGGIDINKPRNERPKTKWFPAKPLTSLCFAGRVTFVGPNCEIYIQDYMSASSELQLINEEVHNMCTGTEPEDTEWEVGDICIARFYSDKRWYRAEIDQGYNDGCYLVKFVDYGNLEWILTDDLRRPRGLTMRPIQAHICYFDNFAPITDKWEKPQLEDIHSFLVDKICRVELRHLSSGYLGIVKLYLPDHTDALQELVSRRLGRYITLARSSQVESKPAVPQTESTDGSEADTSWETIGSRHAETPGSSPVFWWNWYKNHPKAEFSPHYQLLKIPDDVDTLKVDIMTVISPDMFLVQVYDNDNKELCAQQDAFVELQSALQTQAAPQETIWPPYEFKECCCTYGEDGVWYRGVVLRVLEDRNTVIVQYVDYGNVEEKFIEEVRQLKDAWLSVPIQSVPCRIAGYKFSGVIDNAEAKKFLTAVLSEVPDAIAVIKGRDAEQLYVELRTKAGKLVYEELINNGFFVPC